MYCSCDRKCLTPTLHLITLYHCYYLNPMDQVLWDFYQLLKKHTNAFLFKKEHKEYHIKSCGILSNYVSKSRKTIQIFFPFFSVAFLSYELHLLQLTMWFTDTFIIFLILPSSTLPNAFIICKMSFIVYNCCIQLDHLFFKLVW